MSSRSLNRPATFLADRMRAIDAAVTARVHRKILEQHDGRLGIAQARVMADLGAGSRPTEIAKRLGVTKAAVGQLLGPLEDQGLVTRAADPSDGRAIVFKPTAKAARLYVVGRREINAIEAEWKRILGARRFEQLAATLEVLDGWRLHA